MELPAPVVEDSWDPNLPPPGSPPHPPAPATEDPMRIHDEDDPIIHDASEYDTMDFERCVTTAMPVA